MSAAPDAADGGVAGGSGARPVLVWDLPTRLFHWMLAASFAGAWLTAEDEGRAQLHFALGCTAAALIAFRIVWGFAGTRYARFSSLDFRPRAAVRYLRSLLTRAPEHHAGHNPAASWAIAGILGLVAATAASGWFAGGPSGHDRFEELHEAIATAALALVGLHVLAVAVSSVLHRENLARAMLTGMKRGAPGDGAPALAARGRSWAGLVALAASLAVLWMAAPWSGLSAEGEGSEASAQPAADADD